MVLLQFRRRKGLEGLGFERIFDFWPLHEYAATPSRKLGQCAIPLRRIHSASNFVLIMTYPLNWVLLKSRFRGIDVMQQNNLFKYTVSAIEKNEIVV